MTTHDRLHELAKMTAIREHADWRQIRLRIAKHDGGHTTPAFEEYPHPDCALVREISTRVRDGWDKPVTHWMRLPNPENEPKAHKPTEKPIGP